MTVGAGRWGGDAQVVITVAINVTQPDHLETGLVVYQRTVNDRAIGPGQG